MNWCWHIGMALAALICSTWIFGGVFIIWMQIEDIGLPTLHHAFIALGMVFIVGGILNTTGIIQCWRKGS